MKIYILHFIIAFLSISQLTQAQTVTYQYDDLNRLTQADYGNGTIIQYSFDKLGNRTQYVITGSATPPDLEPTALSISSSTVSSGGQVSMSYTLNNNGQIAAGQNTARFYINSSATLTGATLLDDHSFSAIAGNSGLQYTKLLTIPGGTTSGPKYLLIDVDAYDDVAESDETNNAASIAISIQDCPTITINFSSVINETCEEGNGSIVAEGSGGSIPYTWEWNSIPSQYTNVASNLVAGSFTVTITDANGCFSTATQTIINEEENPASSFSYSTAGLTVGFASTSTGATSWFWDFGDGNFSAIENPTHTFAASGSYLVCLESSNTCGVDNSCQTVTVDAGQYVEIESAPGVQLLRKQTVGDDPDFIQVIDLSEGAYIEFDHGDITSGAGTANPFFTRENIDDVWTEKSGQYNNIFSVTNGQFFNAGQSPSATLAFPVKQNGAMISDGYGNTSEFVGEKEFLGIWTDLANVTPYNDDPASVASSSAIAGIVGLDKDANKNPINHSGRTFAGVKDEDRDGIYEKVLIFSSKSATQAYAAQQLNDMGVPFDKIIMLDGGGSTQLKCNGVDYVDNTRLVPQYIVVYSATYAVPECTQLTNPVNGSFDVLVDEDISWNTVSNATGYKLTIGTTPGSSDIMDNLDVGNVISYDPGDFPYAASIYVTITPYNTNGDAIDCTEESFTTINLYGCTDLNAHNYNQYATEDDGTCETCTDGIQNGDETGVDCGGVLCDPCGCHPDRDALISLYTATNGDNWTNSWDTTNCDVCNWYGVTCDINGRVTCIDLDGNDNCAIDHNGGTGGNNLTGTLPSEIGQLQYLRQFSIKWNNVSGTIPEEIYNLDSLRILDLYANNFIGGLSNNIGNLTFLEQLNVGFNNLGGTIPPTLYSLINLKDLWFPVCGIGGQLDPLIGNLTNLQNLSIRGNNFNGLLPEELWTLTSLEYLYIKSNNWDPYLLPNTIDQISNLKVLDFQNSNASGQIPSELGNLPNLQVLFASNNDLVGCFPTSLNNYCSGVTVNFTNNPGLSRNGDFSGFCTSGIGECVDFGCTDSNAHNYNPYALSDDGSCETCTDGIRNGDETEVDCGGMMCDPCQSCDHPDRDALIALYNSTNGDNWTVSWDTTTCDPCTWYGVYCNANDRVELLDLDGALNGSSNAGGGNNLVGSIPPEITELTYLEGLFLQSNSISSLPGNFGDLDLLYDLDLDLNDLTSLPATIGDLNSLAILKLYANNLTSIPATIGNLPQIQIIEFNSNNISELPASIGDLSTLTALLISNNNLISIPPEIQNATNLGSFSIDGNNLTSLPNEIVNMPSLWRLDVARNQLTSLPPGLGDMPTLSRLEAENNNLQGCFTPDLLSLCSYGPVTNTYSNTPGYNFLNNPMLPFHGNMEQICNGADQFGAPCNDGDSANGSQDVILSDCSCGVEILGCTDPSAHNYNPNANVDDGSCETCSDGIQNGDETGIDCGGTLCGPCGCGHPDFNALVDLYNNLDGANWATKTGWEEGAAGQDCDPCSWYGVTCANNRVVSINMDNNGLAGIIPNSIGDLTELIHLTLRRGNITSPLPSSLATLSNLSSITLDNNIITEIPDFIGSMDNLGTLLLYRNNISNFPDTLCNLNNLSQLRLDVNSISGSIPSNIGNMISLVSLNLSNSGVSGAIPTSIGNLSNLQYCALQYNNLTGQIPETIGNLTLLGTLDLSNNNLSNCFPSSLLNLCGKNINFMNNPLLPGGGDFAAFCADQSGICSTCEDGIQNGDETGIDCGGSFCAPCMTHPQLISITYDKVILEYPVEISSDQNNLSEIIFWGEMSGFHSGAITINQRQLTFNPTIDFIPGERIQITSTGSLMDINSNPLPAWVWEEYIPVTNPTTATFVDTYTGIQLAQESVDYSTTIGSADFNQDGLMDIVVRYHSAYGQPTKIYIILRNQDGSYATPVLYTNSYSHSGLRGTPDLNNDGYPDLLLTHNVPSNVHVRLNNGDGTFGSPSYYSISNYSNGVVYGDIDADGDIDIVGKSGVSSISSNTISILRNNGNGTFAAQETINTSAFGNGLELGDFDKDGDFDIIYSSSTSFGSTPYLRIYENNGSGQFSQYSSESNPNVTSPRKVLDFDGNGTLDVFSSNPGTGVLFGNGTLQLPLTNYDDVTQDQVGMYPGDLDGDGDFDIFQYRQYNGSDWFSIPIKTWLHQGNMQFDVASGDFIIATRPGYSMADMDDDGDLDMLYMRSDGKIYYAQNIDCRLVCFTPDDNLPGSLRYSIDCAQPGDTITFDPQLANDTLELDLTELTLDKQIHLIVPNEMNIYLKGSMSGLLMKITPSGQVMIDGLKIVSDANSIDPSIKNEGDLTLKDVTIYADIHDPTIRAAIENLGNLIIVGATQIIQKE